MFGVVSSLGFSPAEVFPQLRFFSSLKGKSVNIMQLHLTTTPLKSEVLCCAPSVNNHLFFVANSPMHPEGHSSMRLLWNSAHHCLLCKSENSSQLAALYSPGISRLSGWSSWARGNKNGPNSMLGNLHRATMSSLELRALCLSVHTAHNLQQLHCNFDENTQAHARPCLGQTLECLSFTEEQDLCDKSFM